MDLPGLRDLERAEQWYRRSLELSAEGDRLGRGQCYHQLGVVAYERFQEARAAGRPEAELLVQLKAALAAHNQALALLPPDAVDDLAVTHNQLGNIYDEAGDLDRALPHWREAIRFNEMQDNFYGAAQTRFNIALALAQAGRLEDARAYALAALRNYETYGPAAAAEVERTRGLLADIEEAMGVGSRE
jgi:tetratricopeptide (TPR) repeat protein